MSAEITSDAAKTIDALSEEFPKHVIQTAENGVTMRNLVQFPQRNTKAVVVIGPTPRPDTMEVPTVQDQYTPTPLNSKGKPRQRAWQRWTEREDALLRAAVPEVNTEVLAFILDRTPKSVLHRIHSLGLRYLEHPARFWVNVRKTSTCWEWIGCKQTSGYGYYSIENRTHQAHRVSYEMAHGPIPKDHHIHHKCRNRACVNPDHLEPIHKSQHVLIHDTFSGRKSRQTHCIHGHEFTEANTYRWRSTRKCRICMAANARKKGAA